MQIKKIAVLGLGSIGTRHFMNVLEMGLEAIGFDPDLEKREAILAKAAKKYPMCQFSVKDSVKMAIQKCDAAVVANPHKHHFKSLSECVDASVHCMVEKPLSIDFTGLEEVLNRADERGLTIAVGFNMRFRPVVVQAQQEIKKLGRIHWSRFICASYLPDWRKGQDYRKNYTADPITGGVIFDVSHELDLAHYLFGEGTVAAAYLENSGTLEIGSEDIANIIIKHKVGTISNIHLDYITRPKQRNFECAGENGFLHVDLQTHTILLKDINGDIILNKIYAPEFNNFEYLEELKNFVYSIENRMEPLCSWKDGVKNLDLILQAKKLPC